MSKQNDMNGKIAVVTGATSGIGLATALELARRGARIIGVGRSPERCADAETAVREAGSGIEAVFLTCDLSSLKQVRALAEEILERASGWAENRIDCLINNAGTFSSWYTVSAEGFELQLAVNHLAPFLLTHELIGALKASPAGRIVSVSSSSHYKTWISWNDIQLRKHYTSLWAYKRSKLANVLFIRELDRRLGPGSTVRAFTADPGLVNTAIGLKGTDGIARTIWSLRQRGGAPVETGAATSVFLASEPSIQGSRELYWKDCRPMPSSRYSRRPEHAERLWMMSERMCGISSTDYGL